MSPVQLETLLHYYYDPTPLKQTPQIKKAEHQLFLLGLLVNQRITNRGTVFVRMLIATPLPEWADPRRINEG